MRQCRPRKPWTADESPKAGFQREIGWFGGLTSTIQAGLSCFFDTSRLLVIADIDKFK
jgi:hypothetical protein